jgi:hypothetical protein
VLTDYVLFTMLSFSRLEGAGVFPNTVHRLLSMGSPLGPATRRAFYRIIRESLNGVKLFFELKKQDALGLRRNPSAMVDAPADNPDDVLC